MHRDKEQISMTSERNTGTHKTKFYTRKYESRFSESTYRQLQRASTAECRKGLYFPEKAGEECRLWYSGSSLEHVRTGRGEVGEWKFKHTLFRGKFMVIRGIILIL
jgi:hypothetical protein